MQSKNIQQGNIKAGRSEVINGYICAELGQALPSKYRFIAPINY